MACLQPSETSYGLIHPGQVGVFRVLMGRHSPECVSWGLCCLSAVCLPGYAGVNCTACSAGTTSLGGAAAASLQCTPCEDGKTTDGTAAASC